MPKSEIGSAFGFVSTIISRIINVLKRSQAEEVILGLSQDKINQLTDEFVQKLINAAGPETKPTEPLYLVDTGILLGLPATSELDVEVWVEGLPKYDQGRNFRGLVKGRIEKGVSSGSLRHFRNTRYGNGAWIVTEIKTTHGGKPSCFADIKAFIDSGAAQKDGTWYVFLLEVDGQEWLVYFIWIAGPVGQGWYLNANRPEDYNFNIDHQFLFR